MADKSHPILHNYGIHNYNYDPIYYNIINEDETDMREAHMYIEQFVDIYLFYCLKNTLHMMGNKSSVFAAGYGSGMVNLHACFQVLYIRVEEYERSRDKIQTPWDNSLGSEMSPDIRLTYTDLQAHDDTDDLTAQTSCQVDYE